MDHVLYRGASTEVIASLDSNGVAERLVGIGVPHCINHAWCSENLLAFTVRKGRAVHVWTVEGRARRLAVLETPIVARDVMWSGNRLVIGGLDDTKSRVWIRDFDRDADWEPLETPDELRRHRKGVDALARSGATLVAIDNIVMPKYVATYDTVAPGIPVLTRCTRLEPNGTYEHIVRASSGVEVFAVLSSTVGRSGVFWHLCLYRFADCRPMGRLAVGPDMVEFEMLNDELIVLYGGEFPRLERYAALSEISSSVPTMVEVPDGICQLRKSRMGALVLANADGSHVQKIPPTV